MTDYYSGDWLWNEEKQRYDAAYAGVPYTRWSGGETFIATREVLERIASDQEKIRADNPVLSDDLDRIEVAEDGTATLVCSGLGERHTIDRVGDEYVIGFGWTWTRVEDDEDVGERVGAPVATGAGESNLAHARVACDDPDCEIHHPEVIEDDDERLTALAYLEVGRVRERKES